jgi:hypothetical protein
MATMSTAFFYRLKRFTCGGNPHADMIFLTGAGGYRVDTGRAGQTAVIARQRSGDVVGSSSRIPRIRRDKKGRQPAEMRIGYSVATGLGSGAQLGNGNGQRIQRQRRWRTVTVAPGITISLSSSPETADYRSPN